MNGKVKSYTVVLVVTADGILLISRRKPPYRGMWNGLGGKIEAGESPQAGAVREIAEESGLTLPQADFVDCGRVDWWADGQRAGWLYLFKVTTDASWPEPIMTREGVLAAWPLDWVSADDNLGLVPDLKPLVAPMLAGLKQNYRSAFQNEELIKFEIMN